MAQFTETIIQAFGDYRSLIKKYMTEDDRKRRLKRFDLMRNRTRDSDIELYDTATAISNDLKNCISNHPKNYYSYSGIEQFQDFLSEYLSEYVIEKSTLVHKIQKASRAFLGALQLSSLPKEKLTPFIIEKFNQISQDIAYYGTKNQMSRYHDLISQKATLNKENFEPVLEYYIKLSTKTDEKKHK